MPIFPNNCGIKLLGLKNCSKKKKEISNKIVSGMLNFDKNCRVGLSPKS